MFEIIDVNKLPTLDLHGESSDIARVLIDSFIKENIKLKREFIAIVHGKGTGILRNTTRKVLMHNKSVEEFKLYWFNDGMTVVKLKK
jgi:dsDNA-specific endonuclease/ATPase MutS2